MKDTYIYPIVFTFDTDGILVDFPGFDINCTFGETIDSAVIAAQEVLALLLQGFENEGQIPPTPIDINTIILNEKQKIVFVELWLPYHRAEPKISYQNKTLTIPTWLNMLAERKKVNFSHILTEG